MGDQDKKDSCCSPSSSSNSCCCCKGMKKFMIGILVGILVFAGGFIFAKSICPVGAKTCPMGIHGQKLCPISGTVMGEPVK